jgi:hypothetical protein
MFKKNTAVPGFFIGNFIHATTGAVVVTGTPVEKRTLDGTVGDCTNAASYTSGDQGWKIDLAAGDLNADLVGLSFTLTDCLPICFTIKTVTKLVSDLVDAAAVSAATIADAVCDEAINTGHATADTLGKIIYDALVTEMAKIPKSDSTVTFNTTALSSVQASANAALVANNLDHLMKTAVSDITKLGDGGGNEVPDSTVLSLMLCKGTDTDTYSHTTDSLEAMRDKMPANLEDMSITDTTGIVKADLVTVNAVATTATLDTIKTDTAAVKLVTDKLDTTLVADGAVSQFTANALELGAAGSGLDADATAHAVWDAVASHHAGTGSTGKALAAASSAGDPWSTALPGVYGAGTAGEIIGGLTDLIEDLQGVGFSEPSDSNKSISDKLDAITGGTITPPPSGGSGGIGSNGGWPV